MELAAAALDFVTRFWQAVPLRIWLTAFAIGLILELVLPAAERGHSWRGYWRNLCHAGVYAAVFFVTAPTLTMAVGLLREYINIFPRLDLDIVGTETLAGQL